MRVCVREQGKKRPLKTGGKRYLATLASHDLKVVVYKGGTLLAVRLELALAVDMKRYIYSLTI